MHKKIAKCRLCGNKNLGSILNLGHQALTGVFPRSPKEKISKAPLELVKCTEGEGGCGLVQLRHSADLHEMYGDNYGYRSGLNASMVAHLQGKVKKILATVKLRAGDLVLDIGSNDATLLKLYPKQKRLRLVGIDPVGKKFKQFYTERVELIPDFFSVEVLQKAIPHSQAKVITSIAMMYDLEHPLEFVREVASVLADDGIWIFEQSYMPTMLKVNAYDTICHEHLEYYRLQQIKWMTDRANLKIIDVELNDINGGSISVAVVKKTAPYKEATPKIRMLLEKEKRSKLHTMEPYGAFADRVYSHRYELKTTLAKLQRKGEIVIGWGASTKGNVLLQFCGITAKDLSHIGEVNEEKYGAYTPGTNIPIVSEEEAKKTGAKYLLVLPWHFKRYFLSREVTYLRKGGKFIFPLPKVHII